MDMFFELLKLKMMLCPPVGGMEKKWLKEYFSADKSTLEYRIKEIDEVINITNNIRPQTKFLRIIPKYLKELRIEILGEIERREGKPVTNSIHVEKMWSWTIKKHCREIEQIWDELLRPGPEKEFGYKESDIIKDCMNVLWEHIYIPEVKRRNISLL